MRSNYRYLTAASVDSTRINSINVFNNNSIRMSAMKPVVVHITATVMAFPANHHGRRGVCVLGHFRR